MFCFLYFVLLCFILPCLFVCVYVCVQVRFILFSNVIAGTTAEVPAPATNVKRKKMLKQERIYFPI